MSNWEKYRERSESYQIINLTDPGLEDFWIKLRKLGSFTTAELVEKQNKWLDVRVKYIAQTVVHLANKGQEKATMDEFEKEVDDVITELEGGVPDSAISSERRALIYGHFMQMNTITKFQPLVGLDLEILESWNLTDPVTGKPLSVPKEDISVFEKLTLDVLWHIKEKIIDFSSEAVPPKVRRTLFMSS